MNSFSNYQPSNVIFPRMLTQGNNFHLPSVADKLGLTLDSILLDSKVYWDL